MITLYDVLLSGNAHRARLFLSILGLSYETVPLNLSEGEHKQAAYMKLNPLGQVPTLVDDDVVIRDSTAILVYLAHEYGAQGDWCGKTPAEMAHVQEWLATATRELFFGPAAARAVKLFGRDKDFEAATALSHQLFGKVFEPQLGKTKWLAGSNPTIADIANYSYVALANEGEISLDEYPNIRRWLEDVEELPGFIAVIRSTG